MLLSVLCLLSAVIQARKQGLVFQNSTSGTPGYTTIYYIRHGQSQFNELNKVELLKSLRASAFNDAPLTIQGIRDAVGARAILYYLNFPCDKTYLVGSNVQRAHDTVSLAMRKFLERCLDAMVKILSDLQELDPFTDSHSNLGAGEKRTMREKGEKNLKSAGEIYSTYDKKHGSDEKAWMEYVYDERMNFSSDTNKGNHGAEERANNLMPRTMSDDYLWSALKYFAVKFKTINTHSHILDLVSNSKHWNIIIISRAASIIVMHHHHHFCQTNGREDSQFVIGGHSIYLYNMAHRIGHDDACKNVGKKASNVLDNGGVIKFKLSWTKSLGKMDKSFFMEECCAIHKNLVDKDTSQLDVCSEVADVKKEHFVPVFDKTNEGDILKKRKK